MIAAGLETADKHFGMSFGLGSLLEGRNDSNKRFFSEISSNTLGMAQPCFVAPPPRSNMNMNMYNSAPKLSLTLTSSLEGKPDMFGSSGGESQLGRQKDEDYESRSGSDNMEGNGSGDDQEDNNHPKKKRYHRHTPQQIQEMEALFKECPHPDEKQRQLLSKQLGLAPRQIKFWFQNRRTQMKAQHERHDNALLRQDNEKLRLENMAIKEAMRNPICTNCGGPAVIAEISLQEQQLRIENIRLKDELDRMAAMAGKFYGRPIQLTSLPAMHGASLELGMGAGANSFDGLHSSMNPPSELLLLQGSSVDIQSRTGAMMGIDRSLVAELAIVAMDELMKMLQHQEPLWIRSLEDGRETLNYEEYLRQFPRGIGPKPMTHKTEATRQSGPVLMNSLDLVETLMDASRWKEMFPCILSKAATLEVISSLTGRHGALQLMYMEMQVPSPLVPTREVNFLRFSQKHSEGVWAVVDVSVDGLRENSPASFVKYRRRPSGCLIQDLPNGYSQVTWVEHAEYDDIDVHGLYRTVVNCGLAFGAGRWLATLQRQCECFAVLMSNNVSSRDYSVIANPSGRRSMLKLAQRMTNNYCGGVSASSGQTWTKLSNGDDDVRVTTRKNTDDPGEPSGVVLSAATSVWLPVSPQRLFEFLRDATLRNKWDILSNGGQMQEMANVAKGNDPGNSVSLLGASGLNSNQTMLILQECCTDAYGSLVVYAPIDVGAMHLVMSGGDSSYISLLPSGFAIIPEGSQCRGGSLAVSESGRSLSSLQVGGSLLTVAFQILVSSLPNSKLTMESVETVNNLISSTVKKIKGALGVENEYD